LITLVRRRLWGCARSPATVTVGKSSFSRKRDSRAWGENPGFAPEFCFSPSTCNIAYWH
jgi:hypothetical protein